MNPSKYIEVTPNESEAIQMAYSRGMISFHTMTEKLRALNFFWCDYCRKWLPKEDHGRSYVDNITVCQWCLEKD